MKHIKVPIDWIKKRLPDCMANIDNPINDLEAAKAGRELMILGKILTKDFK